jgi:hypothetical protein
MVVRAFLDNTQSQLTYHGLFNLVSLIEPGSLVALFRNSHLSVLYKSEGEESSLYTLVTDFVFIGEPSVVWERVEDVDGKSSSFVDSDLVRSSPAGGDFAGQTAEGTLRALEAQAGQLSLVDPAESVKRYIISRTTCTLTFVYFVTVKPWRNSYRQKKTTTHGDCTCNSNNNSVRDNVEMGQMRVTKVKRSVRSSLALSCSECLYLVTLTTDSFILFYLY